MSDELPTKAILVSLRDYAEDGLDRPRMQESAVRELWRAASEAEPRLWLYVPKEEVPGLDAFDLSADERRRLEQVAKRWKWDPRLTAYRAAFLAKRGERSAVGSDMQILCDILVASAHPDPEAKMRPDPVGMLRDAVASRLPWYCHRALVELTDADLTEVLDAVVRTEGRPKGQRKQQGGKTQTIRELAERLGIEGDSDRNIQKSLKASRKKYRIE